MPACQCAARLPDARPQVEVTRPETVQELVGHANRARSTGSTGVNEDSSRSHSIMQVPAACMHPARATKRLCLLVQLVDACDAALQMACTLHAQMHFYLFH